MEYATRDQAQQAIQTLSNQNLMGRLVYVREVSDAASVSRLSSNTDQCYARTEKPNLDSQDHLVAGILEGPCVEASAEASADPMAATVPVLSEAQDSSTSPTFVPLSPYADILRASNIDK